MKKLSLILFALICSISAFASGLKGAYTIDRKAGGTKNFVSFTSAIQALQDNGVAGPVVFNIADGVYRECLELDSIIGESATNTITFQSKSNDNTKAIISWPSDSFYHDYILLMNGAGFCHFNNLGFQRPGNKSYSKIIILQQGASYNSFTNCNFLGSYKASTPQEAIISCITENDSNNSFINNTIDGGTNGIFLSANTLTESNVLIEGNTITGFSREGIHLYNQDAPRVVNNTISGGLNGIILSSACNGILIYGNSITNFSSYGIFQEYCGNKIGTTPFKSRGLIANNIISSSASYYPAITSQYCSNQDYIFNTMAVYGFSTNLAAAGFGPGGPGFGNNVLMNNIIANMGGGLALSVSDKGYFKAHDHNDFFTQDSVLGMWESQSPVDINAWRKVSKGDNYSLSVNPKFKSLLAGNLHLTRFSPQALKSGIKFPSVKYDFDRQPRDTINPWIGADEYYKDSIDAGISFIKPSSNGDCANAIKRFVLKVKNLGGWPVNNVTVYAVAGGSINDTVSVNMPGPLAPIRDTLINIQFPAKWNIQATQTYSIKAWTNAKADSVHTNDTAKAIDSVFALPRPAFQATRQCTGDSTFFIDSSRAASGTINSHYWNFGNGSSSSLANPFTKYPGKGNYTVKLFVSNSYGCKDSLVNQITIDSVYANFDKKFIFSTVQLSARDSFCSSYIWNFGDGTQDSGSSTSLHNYSKQGWYIISLTVRDKYGCAATKSDTIAYSDGSQNSSELDSISVFPNPSASAFTISYYLPFESAVIIDLYDMLYHKVSNLANETQIRGKHQFKVNPDNLSQGIYILKIRLGGAQLQKEIIRQ